MASELAKMSLPLIGWTGGGVSGHVGLFIEKMASKLGGEQGRCLHMSLTELS